jgi:16S rRNA (cytosine967-C5)-methyltransferase
VSGPRPGAGAGPGRGGRSSGRRRGSRAQGQRSGQQPRGAPAEDTPPPGRRGSRSGTRVDPARRAAFDLLRAVEERDAYANLVLPGLLAERGLTGRDAALATELAYGTLRHRGTYDAVLAASVDRPLERVDPPVRDVLRLGAHQVLATRMPAHAAVGTAVDLAGAVAGRGTTGFVNAVLRRVARQGLDAWTAQVAPPREDDPVAHLAVVRSHPRWVVEALRDALGDASADLAETDALLAADNARPAVTLAARPGRGTRDALLAAGARPTRWSPYGAVLGEGDPADLAAVVDGRAGVQDEGSQLVALALAQAEVDGAERRWLDLCAGPGGKAALLAGLAAERGARLVAVEPRPRRARLVAEAVAGTADVLVADGRAPAWPDGAYDRVLVDAPCTGLGALRRRPEARWRRAPEDLATLVPLQRALLASALASVRPGGVVAYVTCSPHREETDGVVAAVLDGRDDVVREDARPLMSGAPDLGDGPDVRLWPHVHGTDAMYLCLLRRLP